MAADLDTSQTRPPIAPLSPAKAAARSGPDLNGLGGPPATPAVRVEGVSRRYGEYAAVNEISLAINPGEVFTLLGPSGCGKTTTLRIIAGLETADSGNVWIGDSLVVSSSRGVFVPPHKRNIGMVFQSYAIWPHMTVFENVAYPLEVRRVNRREIKTRVMAMLELVRLERHAEKSAQLLSGGEQQRVAFARALVSDPKLLLLDEPFSNLDAKLREQMRGQVKELLERAGDITVLFVTHDQAEALSLSDRIGLIHAGNIEQIGSPREIYEQPATPFARDFLGRTVLFRGEVERAAEGGMLVVRLDGDGDSRVLVASSPSVDASPGARIAVAIRPEDIVLDRAVATDYRIGVIPGIAKRLTYVGDHQECEITTECSRPIRLRTDRDFGITAGDAVRLHIPAASSHVWAE